MNYNNDEVIRKSLENELEDKTDQEQNFSFGLFGEDGLGGRVFDQRRLNRMISLL